MIEVKAGKTVYICQCGRTKNPPYCDGSHQGTENTALEYTAVENKQLYICGCEKSGDIPFCDGSHSN
ncbi:MAG: CDGSH iron-sulfur domain-containing protein [Gammaproteobacteria bacterium]|nr:CDGSH iron-sulfur domain-containing protein [Gammaproteobacteria bacterium]